MRMIKSINCKMFTRYLLWFAQEHIDFRHAEIQSILSLYDIPMNFVEKPSEKPYWIVELPDEASVKKLSSRSVSIKNCIELWSRASTEAQLHRNLKEALVNNENKWTVSKINNFETSENHNICPKSLINICCHDKKSFKVEVETFCKHFTMKEKIEKIEKFSYLPLEGPVKLQNPEVTLMYLEFYGLDSNNIPDVPYDLFFGRWVADGQRDMIHVHSLKKRHFIGNTSMDAQLALLMANQAQVQPGDLVIDPFVGSGSLLVAAAHFGGYVWGSDIDFLMLHGRTKPTRVKQKSRSKDESVEGNMRQYGTTSKYLDVVVSDFSLPLWRDGIQFDAIITDPPYGVREPTEKIGIEKENYSLSDEYLPNHVPSKVEYGLPHIYRDLLHFAAQYLRLGRRLVCWYPLARLDYREEDLPSHPSLRLIANSEQVISRQTARRLLTYEKYKDFQPHSPLDLDIGVYNFREKFFLGGEVTRRMRTEKRERDMAANKVGKTIALMNIKDVT